MGEIAISDSEIILFYNSKSVKAQQTLSYARAEGLPIQQMYSLNTL